jgi:hypothetical protein
MNWVHGLWFTDPRNFIKCQSSKFGSMVQIIYHEGVSLVLL